MAVRNRLEVTVLPQDFSKEQQEQARKNISAAAISATVSKIESSDGSVSAEAYTAADGSIHYNLKVSAEPVISDTVIHGTNGISAKNQGVNWTIGLSADYLTANALDNLSGNWQNTYNIVINNSGKWNEVSSKLDATAFSTVSGQFAIKTEVQEEFEQTSAWAVETFQPKGNYLSASEKYLSANALDDLSGNWNDVSSKLDTDIFANASGTFALKNEVEIELAKKQDASGMSAYATSSWVDDNYQAKGDYVTTASFEDYKTEVEQEFSSTSSWANRTFQSAGNYLTADALNGYSASWNETSATVKTNSANWDNGYEGYNWISNNSANIVDASATLFNNSGNWEQAYTDVTTLATKSADWNEVSAKVNISDISAESANWNEAYNWTTNNSANIVNTSATFETNSGKWENSYTALTSTSAAWNALSASKLDISAFDEWSANADVVGYSAGANIDITNHIVSGKDWTNTIEEASANAVTTVEGKFGFENNKIVSYNNSAFANDKYLAGYGLKLDESTNTFSAQSGFFALSADVYNKGEVDEKLEELENDVYEEIRNYGYYICTGNEIKPNGEPDEEVLTDEQELSTHRIYLVQDDSATGLDKYREWVWQGDIKGWHCIGDTTLDLTPYVKIANISAVSAWVISNSANIINASATLETYSANWNSVYDTVDSNSSKWENSYTALTSKSADWNEVSAKLDASESAKYMFLSDLKGTEDGKLSGYGSSAFYYPEIPEYSGKDGIKVEDYWITISADYLTANALDELSGNWEQSYTALTATSAKWDSVYTSVNENSASWNETSAFSANSGKFVTSALNDFTAGLAHVLTKDENDNVAWSGIDLSNLGKMYPITSLTPDLVSATISAVDGTSAYVLSAASAAEIPNISGISGISAYFDTDENKYIVGLKDYNAIGFAKFTTSANVYTGTNVFDGYSQSLNLNPEKIALDTDKIVLQPGLYHVDLQCLMEVTGNDNNYYTTVVSTIPAAASITQMVDASYAHEETIDLSFDIRITQDDTALDISVDGFQVGGTYTINNLNIHEIISMPSQIQGGANNYQAGDAIDITNDTLSVKFDSASGIGLNANGQLVVKLGTGLTFDTSGAAAGQLSIDDVTEEVVNTVQTISNDLDTKVTTNFPPAMIIKTDCDIAAYNNAGTLYGNLFNVSINSTIEIDRTMIGVYVYQVDNDKNVILGLYEYQPDYPRYNNEDPTQGISGYGRTVALCDTGVITIPQGTVGFCEYPIKNLNNTIGTPNEETRPSLKSSCMYYATIFMGSDMNSDGLKLYGVTGYAPQVNQIKPGLNICPQNYNLALNDTAYSGQISFNDFGFGWKYDNYVNHYTQGDTTTASISYQEKSDGNRFYMQIRNKPQTSNI